MAAKSLRRYSSLCVGEQIKKARIYKGYKTQGDACTALKISRQVWSLWERGQRIPSVENLTIIANFFQLDFSYFCLSGSDPGRHDVNSKNSRNSR